MFLGHRVIQRFYLVQIEHVFPIVRCNYRFSSSSSITTAIAQKITAKTQNRNEQGMRKERPDAGTI